MKVVYSLKVKVKNYFEKKVYPFNLTNTHLFFLLILLMGLLNQHSSFDFGAMHQLWYTNGVVL